MVVSPNKKRSFLPTLPCAKTGRGRKERAYAEEDDQGGASPKASSSRMARFLETFDPPSGVARNPRACEERDGSPHPLVAQAHPPVLGSDGLVDPGAVDRAVSRRTRAAVGDVLPPPAAPTKKPGEKPPATRAIRNGGSRGSFTCRPR